ncbi:hypothetical protein ES703_91600 [subsurface metagenome]
MDVVVEKAFLVVVVEVKTLAAAARAVPGAVRVAAAVKVKAERAKAQK